MERAVAEPLRKTFSHWWYWKELLTSIFVGAISSLPEKGNLFMKRRT
jgi:hypothetical protein